MKYSKKLIINRLDYIHKNIKDQVGIAIKCYMDNLKVTKQLNGWVVIRLLFPDLDSISTLRYGSNGPQEIKPNSIKYLKEYFKRYDPAYSYGAGLVYYIFRHGLLHQDFPKVIRRRYNKIIYRKISLSDVGTSSTKLKIEKNQITLDATDFYNILLKTIMDYKKEFEDKNKVKELINNFTVGLDYMKKYKTLQMLVDDKFITKTDKQKISKL